MSALGGKDGAGKDDAGKDGGGKEGPLVTLRGRVRWFGIFKLIEQGGELTQLEGKLGAFPEMEKAHPDGKGLLVTRLVEKLGDLYAALDFFGETNFEAADVSRIEERRRRKLDQFRLWHETEGMRGIFVEEFDDGHDLEEVR